MTIRTIKTKKFLPHESTIEDILFYLSDIKEGDIIAISSKIISICEGRFIEADKVDKKLLVQNNADRVLKPIVDNPARMELTQASGRLLESAGIDLSNGGGYYILLPKDSFKTAKVIWDKVRRQNKIKKLGVIITDSHSVPMQKGAVGLCVSSYGFVPIKDYSSSKDIFNSPLRGVGSNVSEALAAAAVLAMGEGNETTPIAVIRELEDVKFYHRGIDILKQRKYLYISANKDVYGPLIKSSLWKKTRKVKELV